MTSAQTSLETFLPWSNGAVRPFDGTVGSTSMEAMRSGCPPFTTSKRWTA